MVVVATGHRPPRLGLDYSGASNQALTGFAEGQLGRLAGDGAAEVVVGMAQGWDQAVGHAALRLGLPLVCALPCDGMEARWPQAAQARFRAILARAVRVHVCHPGKPYAARYFIDRDRWMVDYALGAGGGVLFALWDGGAEGGTWHTVEYARLNGLAMRNAWDDWAKPPY